MTKPILAVDVDLTVVDTGQGWYDYLAYFNGLGRTNFPDNGVLPYNLSKVFPRVQDPMEYWRNLDYFKFEPLEGSVECLRELSKDFHIAFISQVDGTHAKSKFQWLDHHFPFKAGFIPTHEKWLMNGSVVAMIDDRMKVLEGFDLSKRILFDTPYAQDVEIEVAHKISKWDDSVVELIKNNYL